MGVLICGNDDGAWEGGMGWESRGRFGVNLSPSVRVFSLRGYIVEGMYNRS